MNGHALYMNDNMYAAIRNSW